MNTNQIPLHSKNYLIFSEIIKNNKKLRLQKELIVYTAISVIPLFRSIYLCILSQQDQLTFDFCILCKKS